MTASRNAAWLLWTELRRGREGVTWLHGLGYLLEVAVPVVVLLCRPAVFGQAGASHLVTVLFMLWTVGFITAVSNASLRQLGVLFGSRARTGWELHGRPGVILWEALLRGAISNFGFMALLPAWVGLSLMVWGGGALSFAQLFPWVPLFLLNPLLGSLVAVLLNVRVGGLGSTSLQTGALAGLQLVALGSVVALRSGVLSIPRCLAPPTGMVPQVIVIGPVVVAVLLLVGLGYAFVHSEQQYRRAYLAQRSAGSGRDVNRGWAPVLAVAVVSWPSPRLRSLVQRELLRHWTHPLNWFRTATWAALTVLPFLAPGWFDRIPPAYLPLYPVVVWVFCFGELLGVAYQGDSAGIRHAVVAGASACHVAASKVLGLAPTVVAGTAMLETLSLARGVALSVTWCQVVLFTAALTAAVATSSFAASWSLKLGDEGGQEWGDLIIDQVPLSSGALAGFLVGALHLLVTTSLVFDVLPLPPVTRWSAVALLYCLALLLFWLGVQVVARRTGLRMKRPG